VFTLVPFSGTGVLVYYYLSTYHFAFNLSVAAGLVCSIYSTAFPQKLSRLWMD
jgi:hypothetical protein